jgi:hypothetical protein
MSTTIISYKKYIERNFKNDKYNILNFNHKKHFLLCENCFWMTSTLPYPLDHPLNRYRKCPMCKNNLDTFSIPLSF